MPVVNLGSYDPRIVLGNINVINDVVELPQVSNLACQTPMNPMPPRSLSFPNIFSGIPQLTTATHRTRSRAIDRKQLSSLPTRPCTLPTHSMHRTILNASALFVPHSDPRMRASARIVSIDRGCGASLYWLR